MYDPFSKACLLARTSTGHLESLAAPVFALGVDVTMFRRLSAFFQELKRRRVYRVAVAYAGIAFVLWQVADIALPALRLPEWSLTLVVALTAVGFPLALVGAWAFELTPDGIVRAPVETAPEDADPATSSPDTQCPEPFAEIPPAGRPRLAILPLANIHPERDQDYFADGMTEELISIASRIHGLDVIARTSAMAYRDTNRSVSEIGRELEVGAILEGSVRKAGDQLRITVQLIDVRTQSHLWSADFDRRMRDIFEVQSEIAREVAGALEITLVRSEQERVDRAPTDDLEAYDLYLLARHELAKRSASGIERAIAHLQRATELDPGFAPGHAGLADSYVLAALGYAAVPDALQRAEDAARRAIMADPELPEAHTSLGFVALNRSWDWQTAERELARAVELNPSDARAHQWYAQVALYRQQYGLSARRYERALELDPLSVVIQNESGWPPMYMGEFEAAAVRFRKAEMMDPSFAMAHFNQGNCHEAMGRIDDALQCYERAAQLSNRSPIVLGFLGRALAREGRYERARSILGEIAHAVEEGASFHLGLAMIHEALEETEPALDQLEQALDDREPLVGALDTEWLPMASLQGEPRFREVVGRVHAQLGLEG